MVTATALRLTADGSAVIDPRDTSPSSTANHVTEVTIPCSNCVTAIHRHRIVIVLGGRGVQVLGGPIDVALRAGNRIHRLHEQIFERVLVVVIAYVLLGDERRVIVCSRSLPHLFS